MPVRTKIKSERERLEELLAENEALRNSLAAQLNELEQRAIYVEKGYEIAQMVWQNRSAFSSFLSFCSPGKPKPDGDLAE